MKTDNNVKRLGQFAPSSKIRMTMTQTPPTFPQCNLEVLASKKSEGRAAKFFVVTGALQVCLKTQSRNFQNRRRIVFTYTIELPPLREGNSMFHSQQQNTTIVETIEI